MTTNEAESSGYPVEATTPEIIYKFHDLLMNDGSLKVYVFGHDIAFFKMGTAITDS